MKAFSKIFFLFAAFLSIGNTAQAQCDSTNSPTFQVATTPITLTTNSCGVHINIINVQSTAFPGGIVNYTLFSPGGNPVPTPTIIAVAGIWTVVAMDGNNFCVTTKIVQINIVPEPTISVIASSTLICSGYPTTLTASGANSYTWNTGATTSSIVVNPISVSIYSVAGSIPNTCLGKASQSIAVMPLPSLSLSASQNIICLNTPVTLTASGASTYSWATSQTVAVITATPSTNTYYTVYGTGANGCETMRQLLISITPCTSIEDFADADQFKMFPNPADGFVELKIANDELSSDVVIVSIYNRFGQIVRKEEVFGKEKVVINTNDLANDVYFLQIKNGEFRTTTKKLIVQH